MTSEDWGIIISILFAGFATAVPAWMAYSKLNLIVYRLDESAKTWERVQAEIADLWGKHNHQEGRLFMHDKVLCEIMRKMNMDPSTIGFTEKEKPHYRGNPE